MAKPAKTGRPPKGSERTRRASMIDAARRVFARVGYRAATIDAIAREAGAAKRTLYETFGDKAALFEAVIAAEAGAILAPQAGAMGLRERLEALAYGAFVRIHTHEKTAIHRMVVAEAPAFPALARGFYRNGPGQGIAAVGAILAQAHAKGEIVSRDPAQDARHFFGLVMGEPHLRLVLGLAKPPGRARARAQAKAVVDFFLRALAR